MMERANDEMKGSGRREQNNHLKKKKCSMKFVRVLFEKFLN